VTYRDDRGAIQVFSDSVSDLLDAEMTTHFDLLFLGHFAVDRNVVDGVAKTESGGGVYYGGIAARQLGSVGFPISR
jgi:hypothetical protein